MRRIKLILATAAVLVATLVVTAGPAMADHTNRHENRQDRWEERQDRWEDRWEEREDRWEDLWDNDGLIFTGFSPFGLFAPEIDVNTEEVGENNDWEGECFVTDIDSNGSIDDWEVEITCYV